MAHNQFVEKQVFRQGGYRALGTLQSNGFGKLIPETILIRRFSLRLHALRTRCAKNLSRGKRTRIRTSLRNQKIYSAAFTEKTVEEPGTE